MTAREFNKIASLFNQLIRAPRCRFPPLGQPLDAPEQQGVYVIYSPTNKVLHVGSTPRARKGLAQRLRNHMATQSSFASNYLSKDGSRLRKGYTFRCVVVPNPRHRALLEAYAIGRLCPAHIGLGRSTLEGK